MSAPAGFRAPAEASALPHLGTYTRVLPVTLTRMYENALDWAHLPHLHADSFAWIECEDAGTWGWRARVGLPTREGVREATLELLLDMEQGRWVTRTLAGANAGSEIWTHVLVHGPTSLSVVVDFFVPGIEGEARGRLGAAYARVYEALYDEDQAMMITRERELSRPGPDAAGVEPAPGLAELAPSAPAALDGMVVEHEGRRWRLVQLEDDLLAFEARCPHWLGPLDGARIDAGVVHCPWHGYGFDIRTGACVTGQSCRLQPARAVAVVAGRLTLA